MSEWEKIGGAFERLTPGLRHERQQMRCQTQTVSRFHTGDQ